MDGIKLENQLEDGIKNLILKMEKDIKSKDSELESKDKEIDSLKKELEILRGQLINKNKKLFGKSSEQVDSHQITLFNEAEKECDLRKDEPTLEEITYIRKKPSQNTGKKDNLSNLEVVVIEHKLSQDKAICNECNTPLIEIGKKEKDLLKYIPAKLYIERHVTYSYACKSCEEISEEANIISTTSPKTLLHKSMASNELLAHSICLKYLYSLPLYRQENYFKMLDVKLSRQTLSNWMMGAAREFNIVYDFMRKELLKSNYIQADETTLKVIDNAGKESKSKKYMWLYKTHGDNDSIIIYDYQPTRSSSCPKAFLGDYSGYLQTDGYTGYNKVENAKRIYCLAHIRRKYYDIVSNLDKVALKKSRAIIGFNYCEEIYKVEKELREAYGEDEKFFEIRYKERVRYLAPIFDKFQKYVQVELENALPKSPLGQALQYSQKLLPYMKTILEDGSLEVDNNAAERSIKPFVIGRKNWLFCNNKKGANSSAIIYSIIETSKSNNLAVEKYLVYLMDFISSNPNPEEEYLLKVMPWSETLPEDLKLQKK
ncbi:MAG: IS66 family transposase [Terrisporobacter sp.]|uniref:IS66 family transposase n=1 Tax=Terrisporobacter sp. TaxID=1965305 RepID=UPI002FC961C3